ENLMKFYLASEDKLIFIHNKKKYSQFCDILGKNKIFLKNDILHDKYIITLIQEKQYLKVKHLINEININKNNISASLDEIVKMLYSLDFENGIKSVNIFIDIFADSIIETKDNKIIPSQKYKILKTLFDIALKHIELGHIQHSFMLLDNIFMLFSLFENHLENDKRSLISILHKTDNELYENLMKFYLASEDKLIFIHNKKKYSQFCDILDKNQVLLKNDILYNKYITVLIQEKQYLKVKHLINEININKNNIDTIINAYYNLSDINGAINILEKYESMINLSNFTTIDMVSKIYESNQNYKKALKYIETIVRYNPSKLTDDLRARKFYILQFINFQDKPNI
ncbi:hypothetical protein, partial [Campylobacter devanensis]